mmetsp:Transcript_26111/g.66303  ORF Transcript_26111/g.66303 Transcript_26111/m.66303 type:complete len:213 (+) Transcript_26111:1572-2210(+)
MFSIESTPALNRLRGLAMICSLRSRAASRQSWVRMASGSNFCSKEFTTFCAAESACTAPAIDPSLKLSSFESSSVAVTATSFLPFLKLMKDLALFIKGRRARVFASSAISSRAVAAAMSSFVGTSSRPKIVSVVHSITRPFLRNKFSPTSATSFLRTLPDFGFGRREQAAAMFLAVPTLSPVSIHTLTPALDKSRSVSGTPACNSSSTAEPP